MALTEYAAGKAFPGGIGRTAGGVEPGVAAAAAAARRADVLLVVLDDTGFGQLGCYGSPIARRTSTLAAGGLRYTNMQRRRCARRRAVHRHRAQSPRQCDGRINELATGYPGYNGSIPFENGFLSEMLQQQGYSTYMVGKYHLLPSEFESPAGRSTAGRSGAALSGSTGSWAATPASGFRTWSMQSPGRAAAYPRAGLPPNRGSGRQGDRVHRRRQAGRPNKPFYLHFCTGATHAPHHVSREWADRYSGQFDDGWDAYRQRVFARQKELGIMPPTQSCPATIRTFRTGSPCPRIPASWPRG